MFARGLFEKTKHLIQYNSPIIVEKIKSIENGKTCSQKNPYH